jgi:hypothetical protein
MATELVWSKQPHSLKPKLTVRHRGVKKAESVKLLNN